MGLLVAERSVRGAAGATLEMVPPGADADADVLATLRAAAASGAVARTPTYYEVYGSDGASSDDY